MYKYFYFKTEIKTKVDLYMPCEAMAHSPKLSLDAVRFPQLIYCLTGRKRK